MDKQQAAQPHWHRLAIRMEHPMGTYGTVELDGHELHCTGFEVIGKVGDIIRVRLDVLVGQLDAEVKVVSLVSVDPNKP